MGKFYKPGKVVVILKGRYAGNKGIIVKSNYERGNDRKYPHCLVAGLSKGPKRATKKRLAKIQEKISKLEKKENSQDKLALLKSFGVFIKTYNMSHILVTRYNVKEDFGVTRNIENLDKLEEKFKKDKAQVDQKEKSKKDEDKKELEDLKAKLGKELSNYKNEVKNAKIKIGTEMYKRFMQGFQRTKDQDQNERQEHTEFFFKKLHF